MPKITFENRTYEVDDNVGNLFATLKAKLIDSEAKIKEIETETKKAFLVDKAISLGAKEDDLKDKSLDYIEGFIAGKGDKQPNTNNPIYTGSSYDDLVIEL